MGSDGGYFDSPEDLSISGFGFDNYPSQPTYTNDFIDEIDINNKHIKAALFDGKIHQIIGADFRCYAKDEDGHTDVDNGLVAFQVYADKVLGVTMIPDLESRIAFLLEDFYSENSDEQKFLFESANPSNLLENPDDPCSLGFKVTYRSIYLKIQSKDAPNSIFQGSREECSRMIRPLNSLCLLLKSYSKNDINSVTPFVKEFVDILHSSITSCAENIKVISSSGKRDFLDCYEESLTDIYKRVLIKATLYGKLLEFVKSVIESDIKKGRNFDELEVHDYEVNRFDAKSFKKDYPDLYDNYMICQNSQRLIKKFDVSDSFNGDLAKLLDAMKIDCTAMPIHKK